MVVSWGSTDELLVGSSSLTLYHVTNTTTTEIWHRNLSKPVKFAKFSYDASLIASTSTYDSIVKLWQRQSFGSDDARFEYIYLPHPAVVTDIHWRRPDVKEHHDGLNIIYTICADNHVRMWAPTDAHSPHELHQVAQIDMHNSIQPRVQPTLGERSVRYAFIIDASDFHEAAQSALNKEGELETSQHIDRLREVIQRKPDLCVIVDDRGHMSAWGIDSVDCRARKDASTYHLAHAENFDLPSLSSICRNSSSTIEEDGNFASFHAFYDPNQVTPFNLLIHRFDRFDGSMSWFGGTVEAILAPGPRAKRLQSRAVWDGHGNALRQLIADQSTERLLSSDSDGELITWQLPTVPGQLQCLDRITSAGRSDHILYFSESQAVLHVHKNALSLWSLASNLGRELASADSGLVGKILGVEAMNLVGAVPYIQAVTLINDEGSLEVWKVLLPKQDLYDQEVTYSPQIQLLCKAPLLPQETLTLASEVGTASTKNNEHRRRSTKTQIATCTSKGIIRFWDLTLDIPQRSLCSVCTATVHTEIENAAAIKASSSGYLAVVNIGRTNLAIWDFKGGFLDFQREFPAHEPVQDFDWWSTADDNNTLGLALPHRILILVQSRFDTLCEQPTWRIFREIHTKDFTLSPINSVAWLQNHALAAGVGSQIFVYSSELGSKDDLHEDAKSLMKPLQTKDLSGFTQYTNSPLVMYHPQMVTQYLLSSEIRILETLVLSLHRILKFYVPGDELDGHLGLPLEMFYQIESNTPAMNGTDLQRNIPKGVDGDEELTGDLAVSLCEKVDKMSLPHIHHRHQHHLVRILYSIGLTAKDFRSVDTGALRYIILFRQCLDHSQQGYQNAPQTSISYREYVFALHSTTQDLLVNIIVKHSASRLLWPAARASGLFMWLSDMDAVRQQFEMVARNEYTKTDEKNPTDCALYYLALRKKQVLLVLWRMATWNREQRSTMKLLSNNFEEARWKTAALKNAYALLGKRRFAYAASFFLLADKCQDAVNICVHQLRDLQLGVAIARVYEGDRSPTLRHLLRETILPDAAKQNHRFQAHWAFWMLGDKANAIKAFYRPLTDLIAVPEKQPVEARSWQNADPTHLIMYRELRHNLKRQQDIITGQEEWNFVMRTVRLYRRMSCDLMALSLVRNWEFLERGRQTEMRPQDDMEKAKEQNTSRSEENDIAEDDEEESDDEKSSEEDDSENDRSKGKKPPPTQFQEPSASSLLDNFGF